jgi:SIR2-like domain
MSAGSAGAGGEGLSLREETWETLVDSIVNGECTPFLGAGVAVPYLPRGAALAASLAQQYDYPLDDVTNLARVAQYIASQYQPSYAKRRVCERLAEAQRSTSSLLGGSLPQNHLALAQLGLPVYVTTNYDDYLERAVAAVSGVQPNVVLCRWSDRLAIELPPYPKSDVAAAAPTIFYLHGHMRTPNSILLTEDDYIDFTVSLARRVEKKDPVIPFFVRQALGNTKLLFIGYSLEDWNFRVLMRYLMKQQGVLQHDRFDSISVQLSDPHLPPARRRRAEEFLEAYLKTSSSIDVYWGDAEPFLDELLHRVERASPSERRAS